MLINAEIRLRPPSGDTRIRAGQDPAAGRFQSLIAPGAARPAVIDGQRPDPQGTDDGCDM